MPRRVLRFMGKIVPVELKIENDSVFFVSEVFS